MDKDPDWCASKVRPKWREALLGPLTTDTKPLLCNTVKLPGHPASQRYRLGVERPWGTKAKAVGMVTTRLDRDDGQPSAKGAVFRNGAYACSSQTKCRWVASSGLRYSRPAPRGEPLRGSFGDRLCCRCRRCESSKGQALTTWRGNAAKGCFVRSEMPCLSDKRRPS